MFGWLRFAPMLGLLWIHPSSRAGTGTRPRHGIPYPGNWHGGDGPCSLYSALSQGSR
jgi:hypothetical protein